MRAAIYTRVSLDRTGEGAAVSRQLDDARDLAALRGWTVVAERSDNDTSASGKAHRPGFEALLADMQAGTVDAVIAWNLDRLTRNRRDTVRLIETAQSAAATVALVRGSDLDMTTPSGRLVADLLASVARAEIETKGDRQRRANDQRAAAGKPPSGPRAFGYTVDGLDVVEDEAVLVREGYSTILAGGSLRSVARAWNAAGATTSRGNPWDATTTRRVLTNPRNAALRSHRGEIVGPGSWPALVPEQTFRAALHVLSDPTRSTVADRSVKFLLTSIAECGRCDDGSKVATARTSRGKRTYKCKERSDVARDAETLDRFIEAVVVARLSRPDAAVLLAPDARHDVPSLRDEAGALRARRDEAAALFASGTIRASQLTTITREIEARLGEISATLADAGREDALAGLVSADDVRGAWDALDISRRRAVVRVLFDRVVIEPVAKGTKRFDPASVRLVWHGEG